MTGRKGPTVDECEHCWVGVTECKWCREHEYKFARAELRKLRDERDEFAVVAAMWRSVARDEREATVTFIRNLSGLDINNAAVLSRLADKIESGAHAEKPTLRTVIVNGGKNA